MFFQLKDLWEFANTLVETAKDSISFRYILGMLALFGLQNYYFEDVEKILTNTPAGTINPFFIPVVLVFVFLFLVRYIPSHFNIAKISDSSVEKNRELLRKILEEVESTYNANGESGVAGKIFSIFADNTNIQINDILIIETLIEQIEQWLSRFNRPDTPSYLYELSGRAILTIAKLSVKDKHKIPVGEKYVNDWFTKYEHSKLPMVFINYINIAKKIIDREIVPNVPGL